MAHPRMLRSAPLERLKTLVSAPLTRLQSLIADRRAAHLSYAQSGEDLIAEFLLNTLPLGKPSYLDIGAHHPTRFSNTNLFYRKGWRGVCVEADPTLAEAFRRQRPRDLVLNVGVGVDARREAEFFVMTHRTLNTFSRDEAERIATMPGHRIEQVIRVPLEPINAILEQHFADAPPSFLSLDVEGLDLAILRTLDFERHRPVVMCIETLEFTDDDSGKKLTATIDFVRERGYVVYADTFINTIFVDGRRWPPPKGR